MSEFRTETDSIGAIEVPADRLWGAQTQRSLTYFSIGHELMPREMIAGYAILKRAAADANHAIGKLADQPHALIVQVCDEILAGHHREMFPLHVWMTGSGTQFNMNVNEVISNRACQLAGTPLGGKQPVHPNDHANLSQSSNDTFPSVMHIAAALGVAERLIPKIASLRDAIAAKAHTWSHIVKIGRTHLQDATPITLGQEWSGYASMLDDDLARLGPAQTGLYPLALGGTAVGTGINAPPGFAEAACASIAALTGLPFVTAPNKVRSPGRARRAGAALRHAAHARRLARQDRGRHPPARLRPARRPRRTAAAGERAGLLDHAGQGQSDAGGSADHDRRPGDGQRRRRRHRGC